MGEDLHCFQLDMPFALHLTNKIEQDESDFAYFVGGITRDLQIHLSDNSTTDYSFGPLQQKCGLYTPQVHIPSSKQCC